MGRAAPLRKGELLKPLSRRGNFHLEVIDKSHDNPSPYGTSSATAQGGIIETSL